MLSRHLHCATIIRQSLFLFPFRLKRSNSNGTLSKTPSIKMGFDLALRARQKKRISSAGYFLRWLDSPYKICYVPSSRSFERCRLVFGTAHMSLLSLFPSSRPAHETVHFFLVLFPAIPYVRPVSVLARFPLTLPLSHVPLLKFI